MDLVYNKYLSFNKLDNDFKILSLNYQITLVDLHQVKDELKHKETNYILLVKELENKQKLKNEYHKAEIKTLRNKKFKNLIFGIGAGLIGGLILSN
jgi:predicted patatin/cPLA2 family phospholipase